MAQDLTPKVALGIGAHPDDLDFIMAGTAAVWAAAGCEIYYLILTNGNKGSADRDAQPDELAERRRHEQREAARLLGVKDVYFCDYEDGALVNDAAVRRDIVRCIRRVRPEAVVTFDPSMLYHAGQGMINHPDHRAAGQAALDAVYPLARDHLSFPELCTGEGLEPHKVRTVLLLNFDKADYTVDVSASIDRKLEALAAHVSQVHELKKIQSEVRVRAADEGAAIGAAYGESFLRIDIAD